MSYIRKAGGGVSVNNINTAVSQCDKAKNSVGLGKNYESNLFALQNTKKNYNK